jgi:hypothetical protein
LPPVKKFFTAPAAAPSLARSITILPRPCRTHCYISTNAAD